MKISEAELDVLQVIWKKGQVTSFDIITEMETKKEWSENTIRTLLSRLCKKGAIQITKKVGKTYTYEPILKEVEFQKEESNHFLEKMYRGSIQRLLLNFVQEDKLSKKDLEDLIKKIEEDKN